MKFKFVLFFVFFVSLKPGWVEQLMLSGAVCFKKEVDRNKSNLNKVRQELSLMTEWAAKEKKIVVSQIEKFQILINEDSVEYISFNSGLEKRSVRQIICKSLFWVSEVYYSDVERFSQLDLMHYFKSFRNLFLAEALFEEIKKEVKAKDGMQIKESWLKDFSYSCLLKLNAKNIDELCFKPGIFNPDICVLKLKRNNDLVLVSCSDALKKYFVVKLWQVVLYYLSVADFFNSHRSYNSPFNLLTQELKNFFIFQDFNSVADESLNLPCDIYSPLVCCFAQELNQSRYGPYEAVRAQPLFLQRLKKYL